MSRPRVLFLTCHLPYPPLSGGRRRELELIRRLSDRFDFHLMVASKTPAEDEQSVRHLAPFCRAIELFPVAPLPPHAERAPVPLQVLRHRTADLSRRVDEVLTMREADLVHVEGFYLADHVPARPPAPLLLVEQNVEYELWRQRCVARNGRPPSLDPAWQHRITRRAEIEAWRRADRVAALTAEDRDMIEAALPGAHVRLVPDGSDHLPAGSSSRPAQGMRPREPLVVFVGNFAYEPNVDAALHLCEHILPRVADRVPDVRAWLVGNAPPPAVRALQGERVTVTGRVSDVVPYLDAADLVVCPLRVGGGMKVKTIEALQRRKALVSSSVGVQGFAPQAQALLAVTDDPERFAELTASLLLDPAARRAAEERAATALRSLPTWDEAADVLACAYEELVGARGEVAV